MTLTCHGSVKEEGYELAAAGDEGETLTGCGDVVVVEWGSGSGIHRSGSDHQYSGSGIGFASC